MIEMIHDSELQSVKKIFYNILSDIFCRLSISIIKKQMNKTLWTNLFTKVFFHIL